MKAKLLRVRPRYWCPRCKELVPIKVLGIDGTLIVCRRCHCTLKLSEN